MNLNGESYLGDGLYAKFDGAHIWLRAPRGWMIGDQEVAMEPEVFLEFLRFVMKTQFAPLLEAFCRETVLGGEHT